MATAGKFYLTTAIDYPNSRPHIGTAFEKIGADVQARYRRMAGYDVRFLMGNDENTIKVAKRAAELGQDPKTYCDEMARQFTQVWKALDISFDDFIQTSEERHHVGCQKFIQKVYDSGYIYKGTYEGLYCEGCESFKTEKDLVDGKCPNHNTVPQKRSEPCHYFALSKFGPQLLAHYEKYPDFIQPESRRNEVISLVQSGLQDVNTTRIGQNWGIRVPFDETFTIWVWFDALLNYITGVGYGTDEALFKQWWPADIHFIGKDITRFHCALWPAMLMAAGVELPKRVFGHGFVNRKNEETGEVQKLSKSLGNVVDPMEIISRFSSEAFRYYFMKECPFPGDGEFSWQRFADIYNADLANNLGNLFSRVVTLVTKNYGSVLASTPETASVLTEDRKALLAKITQHVEACEYHVALQTIWQQVLDPTNRYADRNEPWKQVKTDKAAAAVTLRAMVESLRMAAILLKPFLPRTAEKIYTAITFQQPWDALSYQDVLRTDEMQRELRIIAPLDANGKVQPLFPRIA